MSGLGHRVFTIDWIPLTNSLFWLKRWIVRNAFPGEERPDLITTIVLDIEDWPLNEPLERYWDATAKARLLLALHEREYIGNTTPFKATDNLPANLERHDRTVHRCEANK